MTGGQLRGSSASGTGLHLSSRDSLWTTAILVILALGFAYNSLQNASHEDYRNSNFSKFWMAGHMVAGDLNPYDPAQWYAEHLRLGSTWTPDRIFLYPLPQAFFLVPLAWIPAPQSFLVWSFLSQVIIAASCFVLLSAAGVATRKLLILPLVFFALFFGPVYLTLQIGSIGAIALASLVLALLLMKRGQGLLAGLLLSLLVLKPSQGLPILFLVGLWSLFRRDRRLIVGMLIGGVALLLAGLAYDPHWPQEFLANSQLVSARTLGVQSNVYGFAYLGCERRASCMWIAGSAAALLLLALSGFVLWHQRHAWNDWQAFDFIIPIAFLCAVYLWSYDQLLYVIPITWIVARLSASRRPWLSVLAFLITLDVVSFVALANQAATHIDTYSLATTLLVLACLWFLQRPLRPQIEQAPTLPLP